MKKSFTISLSSPCSEKWESFEPTAHGAFCKSCSKEVVDFTILSDQQIIDFFKNKPLNACGKFRPEQLTHYTLRSETINPRWILWRAGVIALGLALISKPSAAQSAKPVKSEQSQTESQDQELFSQSSNNVYEVSGVVTSLDDGMPLPGINVQKSGSTMSTVTDAEGKFTFPDRMKAGESLDFMFIGYKSQTKVISANANLNLSIQMETDVTQLGGYVVGGARATRTISFRRWWWKLKNVF
jgi:hypothetical protein